MEFDAVEPGFLGARRGGGEQVRQHVGQIGDVGQAGVADPLPVPHPQGFELAHIDDAVEFLIGQGLEVRAYILLGPIRGPEGSANLIRHAQEAVEKLLGIGPAADGQEIDALDEEFGLPFARPVHRVGQFPQAGDEAVVANTQQRARGYVADTRRLDHDGAGPALGKALVPVEHVISDEALLVGAPRHHGRHPGALGQRQGSHLHGRIEHRIGGLFGTGPGAGVRVVLDFFGRLPHG